MRIHVYTVSWNEEKIMPHFLRFYGAVADRIVVYDNGMDQPIGGGNIVVHKPKK